MFSMDLFDIFEKAVKLQKRLRVRFRRISCLEEEKQFDLTCISNSASSLCMPEQKERSSCWTRLPCLSGMGDESCAVFVVRTWTVTCWTLGRAWGCSACGAWVMAEQCWPLTPTNVSGGTTSRTLQTETCRCLLLVSVLSCVLIMVQLLVVNTAHMAHEQEPSELEI